MLTSFQAGIIWAQSGNQNLPKYMPYSAIRAGVNWNEFANGYFYEMAGNALPPYLWFVI